MFQLSHWLNPLRTRKARNPTSRPRQFRAEQLEDRVVPAFLGVVRPAIGDINGDGFGDVIAAQGPGGGDVRVFDGRTGKNTLNITPYSEFSGGVYVATGDVDGDGRAEIATGTGSGGGPHVRIFDGVSGAEVWGGFPYEDTFRGGVYVALADVTGDGKVELITGTGVGGGPRVRVIDPRTNAVLSDFMAYEDSFRGGVNVSAGDIDGDGKAEIITGTGEGGGPRVRVFDAISGVQRSDFFAYEDSFRGGVFVSTGDLDGDGKAEIVTGTGFGGGPVASAFHADGTPIGRFLAGDADYRGGVAVAVGDIDGDGRAEIAAGAAPRSVSVFASAGFALLTNFSPFDEGASIANAPAVVDTTPPRVTGASSLGNTKVQIAFSEPMADSALEINHYSISQVSFNPNAGTLRVTGAQFVGKNHSLVELTTEPQNELIYRIAVLTGADRVGNPLASEFLSGTERIDPKTATFTGTPPVGRQLIDTDGDGLTDNEERRGWLVVITLANGSTEQRWVTSDPFSTDADGDGYTDKVEAQYRIDPRDADTDDDGIADGLEGAAAAIVTAPAVAVSDTTLPRVIGASSISNTTIRIAFSELMANSVLDAMNFTISQVSFNPEAGTLPVISARFVPGNNTIVELTTEPQNELVYRVTVVSAKDLAGNPLASPFISGVERIDPTSATFPGTPPVGGQLIDSDGDGLTDNEERRGWQVVFKPANGIAVTRWVTSDPYVADTDGEGFPDNVEAQLRLDPRDADTDDDLLTDWQEYNEVFSDHLNGDTDADGVDDGTEYLSVHSSPVHADTDGDQIPDGVEIALGGYRNVLVADLPRAGIAVGSTDLRLDVRFTQTDTTGTTNLDSKSVSSQLVQSNRKEFSNTSSDTTERATSLAVTAGFEIGFDKGPVGKVFGNTTASNSFSGSWTSSNTTTSSQETQRAYEESLTTQAEKRADASVQREVVGALMSAAITLRNAGNIAYRIKNVQVTALIQDPADPTKLVPVATLLPQAEPTDGYSLGPLVRERGPVIVSSTTVFPSRIEELMRNPRGLVFRLSNYDIVDELGRNFAFTSKDIVERTAGLTLDFGSADSDGDGEGDLTESHHVATYSGRPINDTNADGRVGPGDHRVSFDPAGRQVGITLRDALGAVGLTAYDERITPSSSLTQEQRQASYSTFRDGNGSERLFRVRDVRPADTLEAALAPGVRRSWEIFTPTGIDRSKDLDSQILYSGQNVELAFLIDQDGDRIPANVEFLLGTSDQNSDTDADTLGDRVEAFVGWQVDNGPTGIRQVYSSPTLIDTDGPAESPADPFQIDASRPRWTDADEAPGRQLDENGDGIIDRLVPTGPNDVVTDPRNPDTDGDGISDAEEVLGYSIRPRKSDPDKPLPPPITTNPTRADTDGDTAPDGVERRLGGNPNDPSDRNLFADDDRDGLANIEETDGWIVRVRTVSPVAFQQSVRFIDLHVQSNPFDADSDGDGIPDGEEFQLKTIPSYYLADADTARDFRLFPTDRLPTAADVTFGGTGLTSAMVTTLLQKINPLDTDGDGLTDFQEVRGLKLGGRPDAVSIVLDPTDADSDNDKRSDGAEAELIDSVATRWVVAVEGKAPKRVYTDPRSADADLDGLADGDEFAFKSDPGIADSDGDGRIDGLDTVFGLSPVAQDFLVTVTYTALKVFHDGSRGGTDGDFGFDFGVRLPDRVQANGLSTQFNHLIVEQTLLGEPSASVDAPFSSHTVGRSDVSPHLKQNGGEDDGGALYNNEKFGIQVESGGRREDNAFNLVQFTGLLPEAARSFQFAVKKGERFAFEGVIIEMDQEGPDKAFFGGAEGIAGKAGDTGLQGGIIQGSTLEAGTTTTVRFEIKPGDVGFYPGDGRVRYGARDNDGFDVDLVASYTVQ